MEKSNLINTIKNNVNNIGTYKIENVIDFFDLQYSVEKDSFDAGCYQVDICIKSKEYHVVINYQADVTEYLFEGDDCQDQMAEYIYGVYESFMQYVNDTKYSISKDVTRTYECFGEDWDNDEWDEYFDDIHYTHFDEIDAYGFAFENSDMFGSMWYAWFLECIDRNNFASNVEGNEDENDPNVKMMADIIYFIKNGPDTGDMILNNPAIGVGIRILKDCDFFDVMVATEDGKQSYTDSFSVEIDEFTEVFDFIFGSIDNIVATA